MNKSKEWAMGYDFGLEHGSIALLMSPFNYSSPEHKQYIEGCEQGVGIYLYSKKEFQ